MEIIPGTDRRVHILDPRDWAHAAGSDFWLVCHDEDMVAAGGMDLANYGWISDGFSFQAASGADFLSSAGVGTTGGFNFDTAEDTLLSPAMFGDYPHALMAAQILGYTPTTLSCEFYMRLAANNDEQASGCGFWESGAADPVAVGEAMAVIGSGGTNFEMHSGAPAEDSGSTDNTTAHIFKITLTYGSTAEWWIDGTSQGTLAIQADLFPARFGAGTQASGSNDPVLTWAHVWYA